MRIRALIVLVVVPMVAGCGASKSCESALRHAQRVAAQNYRRQLRVPGQTRTGALTTAVAVGRSDLIEYNDVHKSSCGWDRTFDPRPQP